MRLLALDIGTRKTGVAFLDEDTGIPLPLDTLGHRSVDELTMQVLQHVDQRKVDRVIVGLPLLPSGKEGSQAAFVRGCVSALSLAGLSVEMRDERYTTPSRGHPKKAHHGPPASSFDGDAAAACALLQR